MVAFDWIQLINRNVLFLFIQVAVCNLASVNLSAFVVEEPGQAPTYDLQKLYEITKVRGLVGLRRCTRYRKESKA
jgi:hypothetical protein